jgi:UDPglucose--hexose-1-phosphate uridylyltransferase
MLGEWIIVTKERASRPFQEQDHKCPFCPGQPETQGNWDVLTLDNKFPALSPDFPPFPLDSSIIMDGPAYGASKVIVYSRDHNEQFEDMDDKQIQLVLQEYLRVFRELDKLKGIAYVLEFENRGQAVGVSLDHAHGQVIAIPFIPPRIERELAQSRKLWESESTCIVCKAVENEFKSGSPRIIKQTKHFMSLVPFYARLPYEVHIYAEFFEENAYVMAFHTRPSVGEHPYWHFHIEFYPIWRDRKTRKYLGGIETGGWTYMNDSTPEESAKELREVV